MNKLISTATQSIVATLITAGMLTLLTGCGGETIIDKIDEGEASITFVNSLDDMSNFHLKRNDILRKSDVDNLFSDKYSIVSDIEKNSTSTSYRYQYSLIENAIHVGVIDSLNLSQSAHTDQTLSNKGQYWAIAWHNGDDYAMTAFKKASSDQSGVYKIRVFTHQDMSFALNGVAQNENIQAGKVTEAFSITNCAEGLMIGGNEIDLCNGDFGQSYLVIADENGLRLMLPE